MIKQSIGAIGCGLLMIDKLLSVSSLIDRRMQTDGVLGSFGIFSADSLIQEISFTLSPCVCIVINFVFKIIRNRHQYHFEIHSGPSATKHVTASQINHSPFRMCSALIDLEQ